jgi:hypothetical protein
MQSKLLPIALATILLGLTACAGLFGSTGPELTPEEKVAQEKANAEIDNLMGFSFEGTAESVILVACNDLYSSAKGHTDYVRVLECYHEQIGEPDAQAQSKPRDLSPRSTAPKDLSPKTQ